MPIPYQFVLDLGNAVTTSVLFPSGGTSPDQMPRQNTPIRYSGGNTIWDGTFLPATGITYRITATGFVVPAANANMTANFGLFLVPNDAAIAHVDIPLNFVGTRVPATARFWLQFLMTVRAPNNQGNAVDIEANGIVVVGNSVLPAMGNSPPLAQSYCIGPQIARGISIRQATRAVVAITPSRGGSESAFDQCTVEILLPPTANPLQKRAHCIDCGGRDNKLQCAAGGSTYIEYLLGKPFCQRHLRRNLTRSHCLPRRRLDE